MEQDFQEHRGRWLLGDWRAEQRERQPLCFRETGDREGLCCIGWSLVTLVKILKRNDFIKKSFFVVVVHGFGGSQSKTG